MQTYPKAEIVLTLGEEGVIYGHDQRVYTQDTFCVKAVDTTGAGDTFTGYFLAALVEGLEIPECLKLAAKASAIAVTRQGAAPAIPTRQEVEVF